jgi:hypothetical protein
MADEFDQDYDTEWLEYAHHVLNDLITLVEGNKERQKKLGELTLEMTHYLLKSGHGVLTKH